MERKKQEFVVKESNFSARVKKRWRFPRGKHSKVRQMHKGRPVLPSLGFGSPRATRGIDAKSGLFPVTVLSKTHLLALDSAKEGAVLGRTVGGRKKLELIALAAEKKITILGIGAEKLTTKVQTALEARKKAKTERNAKKAKKSAKKEEKKEKKEKKSESKKSEKGLDETLKSEEEQKEQKKIAEKTLTKRQ
jgi:large subunit ribosomal protein L32e